MSIIEETALSAGQAAVAREQQRLRAEITAFQEFADRVSNIEQLRSVEHDTESFTTRLQRLEIAHQSLEELAHTQQRYLQNRQTDANSLFTELIYDELEASYPGLSAIAAIRSLLDRLELRLWAGLI